MDKKPKNSTSVVIGAQQTNHSECHPEQTNKGLCSHKGCPDAGSHTKRSLDQSPELCPVKIACKSPDLDNSEGTTQNKRNITVKVLSTVEVGEVLRQPVQEIKEMRAQLQGVSADIALQGGVLEQIHMDSTMVRQKPMRAIWRSHSLHPQDPSIIFSIIVVRNQ